MHNWQRVRVQVVVLDTMDFRLVETMNLCYVYSELKMLYEKKNFAVDEYSMQAISEKK